jgi:hypothetical protein
MADAQIDLEATPNRLRRVERSSPTISTCFTYPQPISRSAVRHTSCIPGSFPAELTAATTCNDFGERDDEHPQAHRGVVV